MIPAQSAIDWQGIEELPGKGKLVLLHFFLVDRPLTRTMQEETFSHPDVIRKVREKFTSIRVDSDARPDLFESTIGGQSGLATAVLDGEGDVVSVLSGYAGPQPFLKFLEKADKGYPALKAARAAAARGGLSEIHALGEAYDALDSLRRAEECFRKVIGGEARETVHRAKAGSHERMARLCIMRGKNLEARRHVEEWRKLDPEGKYGAGDRILLTEGLVLSVERKHGESVVALRGALRKFPASAEADQMHFALGFALHQSGQDKPALEALEAGVRKYPESGWAAPSRQQIEHIRNPEPDHQH